jgi:predicted nucleotidyltransferase
MRLKKTEIEAIKSEIKKFDSNAEIYLFGSRTDDAKKGGDIDLLIISDKIKLNEKIKIRTRLYEIIGEQKIDLVATADLNTAFLKYVYERSIQL